MHIEIVAIGDEILRGTTTNTNAAFLSQEIERAGWRVVRHTVLPDDPSLLGRGLKEALGRSEIVMTTGGLGSTCDDLTRKTAAELFDSPFHYHEKLAEDLKRRYRNAPISIEDQATIPSKAIPFFNPLGTAPALLFQDKGKTLILLPGVPREMRALFTEKILPWLCDHFPRKQRVHCTLYLCLLFENQVDPLLRQIRSDFSGIEVGVYPFYGYISIHLSGENPEQVAQAVAMVHKAYSTYIFSSESGSIETALTHELKKASKTIAFAESITGGMMAERMVSVPGVSEVFLGSIVAYSNALKQTLLHVRESTLEKSGAVSRETVREMIAGLFRQTGADYGIAVSGIAGPDGGTPDKPVGTIWAAIGEKGKEPEIVTWQGRGNRETMILGATNRLLSALWRRLVHGEPFTP